MRADAVVHVTQDARALGGARMLPAQLGEACIAQRQFLFFFADARRQVDHQVVGLRTGGTKTRNNDVAEGQAKQHG